VVKRFLDFTRPLEMHQEETNLKDLLEKYSIGAAPDGRANVKVEARSPRCAGPSLVDRQSEAALMNLLLTPLRAMPEAAGLASRSNAPRDG